jgi:hypothetical protein
LSRRPIDDGANVDRHFSQQSPCNLGLLDVIAAGSRHSQIQVEGPIHGDEQHDAQAECQQHFKQRKPTCGTGSASGFLALGATGYASGFLGLGATGSASANTHRTACRGQTVSPFQGFGIGGLPRSQGVALG